MCGTFGVWSHRPTFPEICSNRSYLFRSKKSFTAVIKKTFSIISIVLFLCSLYASFFPSLLCTFRRPIMLLKIAFR